MGVEHIRYAGVDQSSTGVPRVEEPSSFLAKFTLFTGVSRRVDGGTRAEAATLDENSEGKSTENGLLAFSERLLTHLGSESTEAWTLITDFSCSRFSAECKEPRCEKLFLNDREGFNALAGIQATIPRQVSLLLKMKQRRKLRF